MAKFTPGPLAGAISGSIGGSTYSHNRGGAYIRRRATPVNAKTAAQQFIRNALSSLSESWAAVPAADRLSWQTWAQTHPITDTLGAAVVLTGHQCFIQLNSRLLRAGFTGISVPPIDDPPSPLTSLSLTGDIGAGAVTAVYTPTPLPAKTHCVWDAAVVESAGILNVNNLFKRLTIGPEEGESPYNIEARVVAVFGSLVVGQVLHVRSWTLNEDTGLYSAPLSAKVAITTT